MILSMRLNVMNALRFMWEGYLYSWMWGWKDTNIVWQMFFNRSVKSRIALYLSEAKYKMNLRGAKIIQKGSGAYKEKFTEDELHMT